MKARIGIFLLALICMFSTTQAQTTLLSEDFEGGTLGAFQPVRRLEHSTGTTHKFVEVTRAIQLRAQHISETLLIHHMTLEQLKEGR